MSPRPITVVTGAAGFVGRHLAQAFAARGDDVLALDVVPSLDIPGARYARVDLTDAAAVESALRGATTVVHNASIVHTKQNLEDRVWAVNLGGSRNVLAACRAHGVPKLVYISSASAVYEGNDIRGGDETLPYSRISQAPYADSKIAAEKELLAANGRDGLSVCAIRPHVVFGPGDTRLVPNLLLRAKQGTLRFSVGRDLGKLSDFTYVDNLVDAVVRAEERLGPSGAASGEAFFITNGEPMGFFDFVDIFLEALGKPRIKVSVPYAIAYAAAAIKEGLDTLRGGTLGQEDGFTRFAIKYMCTDHYFSIGKATRLLGYEPAVDIREGIRLTVEHLRATGQV